MSSCESYQDRTGDYVCNRCGYQWDHDDDAPACKTDQQFKDEKIARNVEHGRATIRQLKEILK